MSRDILLKDNVIEIIESTFRLLNCHAELEGRNNRVGFRIFDNQNSTLYYSPSIRIKHVQTTQRLNKILEEARETIKNQCIELQPWVRT